MRRRAVGVASGVVLLAAVTSACAALPARMTSRQACGVIQGSAFYPVVPPSGIYIGTAAADRIVTAIERSSDRTLRKDLPALRLAANSLAQATDGATARRAELRLQQLISDFQGYCTNIGVPTVT